MAQSLKEKAFLTTLGVVPEIPLFDVPEFHGTMVDEGLAQIGSSGTFCPIQTLKYVVTDDYANPILVTIKPSGSRHSTPWWLHQAEITND